MSEDNLPENMRGKDIAFAWVVPIRKIVEAARGGCQFCGFIAYRYFESSFLFAYGKASMMTSIPGHSGSKVELSSAFTEILNMFDGVEDDTFTFSLRPRHSKGYKKPDLDRIDISIKKVAMGEEELKKRVPYYRVMTVEVYALKGQYHWRALRITAAASGIDHSNST